MHAFRYTSEPRFTSEHIVSILRCSSNTGILPRLLDGMTSVVHYTLLLCQPQLPPCSLPARAAALLQWTLSTHTCTSTQIPRTLRKHTALSAAVPRAHCTACQHPPACARTHPQQTLVYLQRGKHSMHVHYFGMLSIPPWQRCVNRSIRATATWPPMHPWPSNCVQTWSETSGYQPHTPRAISVI